MKVVVQVSDSDKVAQAIKSVVNLLNDLGGELEEVEVVFHQSAIVATTSAESVKPLLDRERVKVVACRNSLKAQGISEDSLPRGVKVVTSGVGEIVRRQKEGWIYLRL